MSTTVDHSAEAEAVYLERSARFLMYGSAEPWTAEDDAGLVEGVKLMTGVGMSADDIKAVIDGVARRRESDG